MTDSDLEDKIKELYEDKTMPTKEIEKILGIKRHTIEKIIKNSSKMSYRYKNKNLNKEFFKVIDTEEKAYWLGYSWCDGNINVRTVGEKGYTEYCYSLDICERDHKHLYKLKQSLGATNKVEKLKTVKDAKTNDEWRYRFRVKNKDFCKILLNQYKMIPYRTLVKTMTDQIPKNLMKHFIRGVIDADGSVILTKDNDVYISISVTKEMGEVITEFLYEEKVAKNLVTVMPVYIGGLLDLYRVSYGGKVQVNRMLEYLYKDSNISMDRKYDKAMTIINNFKGDK